MIVESILLFLSGWLVIGVIPCYAEERSSSTIVEELLANGEKIKAAGPSELINMLGRNADASLAAVAAVFHEQTDQERLLLLDIVASLGRPDYILADNGRAPWARLLENRTALRVLVEALTDKNRNIRDRASALLAQSAVRRTLSAFAFQIIEAVQKNVLSYEIELLGATDSLWALEYIRSNPRFMKSNPVSTRMAMARLGDGESEEYFLREFRVTKDPEKKAKLTEWLGYIGTPGAVIALASELRSPELVRFSGEGKQSLRVPVIKALHRIFPQNVLFWNPQSSPPTSNDYYIPIENWAQKYLLIQWQHERPPFFWVGSFPTPLPVPQRPAGENNAH